MTKEQCQRIMDLQPVIKEWLKGGSIEVKDANNPNDHFSKFDGSNPHFTDPNWIWRITPQSASRPWKNDEIPVNAIFRYGMVLDKWYFVAHRFVNQAGFACLQFCCLNMSFSTYELYSEWNHSLDGGITWKPCGVFGS